MVAAARMIGSLNDEDLAPASELWLRVRHAVRIAIARGPFAEVNFDRWERDAREQGSLAVEALRWLNDAASVSHDAGSAGPRRFGLGDIYQIDEARAVLRKHASSKS